MKCSAEEKKIPNENKDICVCQSGFQQIKTKCYKVPEKGEWDSTDKVFVCDEGFSMVYSKIEDSYDCVLSPLNKMYNTEASTWECLSDFVEIKGECQKIPKGGFYDRKAEKMICLGDTELIEGTCIKVGDNEVYSFTEKKFVCAQGTFRISDKACLRPPKNSYYDEKSKSFMCSKRFYPKQAGVCQPIP